MKKTLVLAAGFLVSCVSAPPAKSHPMADSQCQQQRLAGHSAAPLDKLKSISSLYDQGCYSEVIQLGDEIRLHARDKYYHFFAETLEFFLPAGSTTEYVPESYERSYLSFLMAASYEHLGRPEDSEVELRRAYVEGNAEIYNFGEDPVNLLLQAVLWENSTHPQYARPLFLRLSARQDTDATLRKFAESEIQKIDQRSVSPRHWQVYSYGTFPSLDWDMNFSSKAGSYYDVKPNRSFPKTCINENTVFVSTETWMKKIAIRARPDYHPLLNLKSWTRLPVGALVGVTTTTAAVGVGAGGCAAGFSLVKGGGNNSGEAAFYVCEASVLMAKKLYEEGGHLTAYSLAPDLRRWQEIPQGFFIVDGGVNEANSCAGTEYGDFLRLLKPIIIDGPT